MHAEPTCCQGLTWQPALLVGMLDTGWEVADWGPCIILHSQGGRLNCLNCCVMGSWGSESMPLRLLSTCLRLVHGL